MESSEGPIIGFTRNTEIAKIIQRLVWNTYGLGIHSRPVTKDDVSMTGEKATSPFQHSLIVGLHLPDQTNLTPEQYPEVAAFINGVQQGMVAQIVMNINQELFPENSPLDS